MSSRRVAGWVLSPLRGMPLLSYVIDSLATCRSLDDVVVATSTASSDDPVADFARESGLASFRGSLDDVAERVLGAGRSKGADAIVRLNADSPLLDPKLVDQGVKMFRDEVPDLVSNAWPRTFPKGQGVEVIASQTLSQALDEMATVTEREHMTQHFYAHADRYAIRSFVTPTPRPEMQLSVDDAVDLVRCERILAAIDGPPWEVGWE